MVAFPLTQMYFFSIGLHRSLKHIIQVHVLWGMIADCLNSHKHSQSLLTNNIPTCHSVHSQDGDGSLMFVFHFGKSVTVIGFLDFSTFSFGQRLERLAQKTHNQHQQLIQQQLFNFFAIIYIREKICRVFAESIIPWFTYCS